MRKAVSKSAATCLSKLLRWVLSPILQGPVIITICKKTFQNSEKLLIWMSPLFQQEMNEIRCTVLPFNPWCLQKIICIGCHSFALPSPALLKCFPERSTTGTKGQSVHNRQNPADEWQTIAQFGTLRATACGRLSDKMPTPVDSFEEKRLTLKTNPLQPGPESSAKQW